MLNEMDTSAITALLGSIIGAGATLLATWLTPKIQSSGKISLYLKMVYSCGSINKPWGFYKDSKSMSLFMQVPLWLDVINTSGVPKVIRNLNLYAYANHTEISAFTQIQRISDGKSIITFGDNESYTLVVPPNSARRFNLHFVLNKADLPADRNDFDELVVTYFDERDKIKAFCFTQVGHCWIEGPLAMDKKWIALDRRCNYAR